VGLNNNKTKKEESMKRVAKWIMIVAVMSMVGLMFAQVSSADVSKVGAWSSGISTAALEGFTGDEAIVTETGTIQGIRKVRGTADYQQFKLKTESGTYNVFAGPGWFISHQKIKFAVNDKVEVRGKKWSSNIIATEISKGEWTMKLRSEEDGMAAWQCCFPREK
jgi:hypothetical protein